MLSEKFSPFSIKRVKSYRIAFPRKGYVEDSDLQMKIAEDFHHQPPHSEKSTIINAKKLEIQGRLLEIQDSYQSMMDIKTVLNNAYQELMKQK